MKCSHCHGTGEEPPTNGLTAHAQEVLAYLNLKAGRNFQPTRVNLGLIAARLKEGATVAQCKAVISRKAHQWTGTEWEYCLRPSTLFNATKWSQYQGELPAEAFRG